MNSEIKELDVVALLEDVPTEHYQTREPLVLMRGSVGTVLMVYEQPTVAYEVEFAGEDGIPYAMLPLRASQLLVLQPTPKSAAA
jgi:hypothetical protein